MNNKQTGLYYQLFTEIGIINQLSRARAERHMPDGLTMSHFTVINHLIRVQDGQTPLAMARAFQIPKTTLTHTLSGLEKEGLIQMRPNPKDGRSKCVWLTEKGTQFRDKALSRMTPGFATLANSMKTKEVESIVPILVKIRQFLDSERDNEDNDYD